MGPVAGTRSPYFSRSRVAHVGVQREVERLDLLPEAVEFLGEIVGRHVVFGAPHGAVVLEAELPRAFVGQLDVADEVLADGLRDGVPAGPGILAAALGSRLSARILLSCSRSLQLSGPLGQYLPLP